MKLRVLNDLQIMQTKPPVSYVKLKRFDIIKAEYDGKGSFLCEKVLVDKKYFTHEITFELPSEWYTTIPDLEKIKIPANIPHTHWLMIENFMNWFNNINDDIDLIYVNAWEAYGLKGGRRDVTDFISEFTSADIKFIDFFDIYYFRVIPWLERINSAGLTPGDLIESRYMKREAKVVNIHPDIKMIVDYKNKTVERPNDSILLEADNILNGDRNEQYNDPNESFAVYAEILKSTFGLELTPVEICKVQMAIKLGRLKYKYKRDSLVDLCGYSEILNRLESNNDNNN
jgi:hypothetical protein